MTSVNTEDIWKQTKNGGEWTWFEEIVKDPYFKEKVKPLDGFKIIDGEYTLSVKVYENGSMIVFRNKPVPRFGSKQLTSRYSDRFHTSCSQEEKRSMISSEISTLSDCQQITGMKYLKLDEYHLQKDWKIFQLKPIVIIKDEPYVILITSSVNAGNNRVLKGAATSSTEDENDFTNAGTIIDSNVSSVGDIDG